MVSSRGSKLPQAVRADEYFNIGTPASKATSPWADRHPGISDDDAGRSWLNTASASSEVSHPQASRRLAEFFRDGSGQAWAKTGDPPPRTDTQERAPAVGK